MVKVVGKSIVVIATNERLDGQGLNPTADISRIKFFYPEKTFQLFSQAKNVSSLFSTQQDNLVASLKLCVIVVKMNFEFLFRTIC